MASNDSPNLLERVRGEGYEVDFDPPGNGMCFYAATGHQLGMSASAVQKLLFNYLHHHRYEVCILFLLILTYKWRARGCAVITIGDVPPFYCP